MSSCWITKLIYLPTLHIRNPRNMRVMIYLSQGGLHSLSALVLTIKLTINNKLSLSKTLCWHILSTVSVTDPCHSRMLNTTSEC